MIDLKTALRWGLLNCVCAVSTVHADDFNAAHCQAVTGTLNIFWEEVAGPNAPCTGIEYTNGTLADASDGSITMSGTSVSNPGCISTAAYSLTLSGNRLSLTGSDTANNVPMTLTRTAVEGCFTGHWVSGGFDFIATLWAAPFPQPATTISTTPLSPFALALAAVLLALSGYFGLAPRLKSARRIRPTSSAKKDR